jgi:hypothetical protein
MMIEEKKLERTADSSCENLGKVMEISRVDPVDSKGVNRADSFGQKGLRIRVYIAGCTLDIGQIKHFGPDRELKELILAYRRKIEDIPTDISHKKQ